MDKIWNKIKIGITEALSTKPRGLVSRMLAPSFSWCYRCGTTWAHTDHVNVTYANGRGCFALCYECWDVSSIAGRKYYYLKLLNSWPEVPSQEQITTLLKNIEAMSQCLPPGTRVKFEWLPAVAWIGPGPMGSSPEGWKYTVLTGTIDRPSELRHKHGHPSLPKVLHYTIIPDDKSFCINTYTSDGIVKQSGVDAYPLEVIED